MKLPIFPTHAASPPVVLIPQCVADRHVDFALDDYGPAQLDSPELGSGA